MNPKRLAELLGDQIPVEHPTTSVTALPWLLRKRLGFDDVVHFDYVDPPSPEAPHVGKVVEGPGIDDNGNITDAGHQASRLPVDPQIAKMLIEAPNHRCSEVILHHSTSLGHRPDWLVFHELSQSSKLFIKTGTQIKPEWLIDVAPKGYFDAAKISEKSSARSKLDRVLTRRFSQDGP
eukprot:Skav229750  [mRNA]  locus=scaffold1796:1238:9351:- [translate_table: standard]